jgi:hypothetical protein
LPFLLGFRGGLGGFGQVVEGLGQVRVGRRADL